jgi:hypothetical protein
MMPASTVNAKNYHLLGNRLTGESRASRMRRVNEHTPYSPSLIQREPAKMYKINPTKPLNLGSSHAGDMNTRITSMVIGGASAFGITTLLQNMEKTGSERKQIVESSIYGALGGLVTGTLSGVALNNEKIGLLKADSNNSTTDNYVLGSLSMIVPYLASLLPRDKTKNRTSKQKKVDRNRAVMLGLPGLVASFTTNANYTVPIYLTALVGTFAARRYSKI